MLLMQGTGDAERAAGLTIGEVFPLSEAQKHSLGIGLPCKNGESVRIWQVEACNQVQGTRIVRVSGKLGSNFCPQQK